MAQNFASVQIYKNTYEWGVEKDIKLRGLFTQNTYENARKAQTAARRRCQKSRAAQ